MGRLIDSDELLKHKTWVNGPSGDSIYDVVFCDEIEEAPTVEAIPMSVLEDIKAEIVEEKEYAYADFEQYKVDYLGVDADYVEDELPNDDFRYGMERCLEIINKHIRRKEDI